MKKRTLLLAVPLWMLLFVPILPMWAQDSKAQRVLRPGVGDPAGTPAKRGPIVGAKPWHREGGKLRKTPRSLVMPNPNQRVRLASADGVEFWGNVIYVGVRRRRVHTAAMSMVRRSLTTSSATQVA